MPDYSKTIVYKLCCKDTSIEDIYVGSTCNFTKRKWEHKSGCNNSKIKSYNIYVYQFIRNNGGFENWDMVMIEEFSCNNKLEKEQKERYYIELLKPTLNIKIPSRNKKEYAKVNKEKISEKGKEYYKLNIDEIKKKVKDYREINKDKIKEYREINKDAYNEYNKIYHQLNKDKLNKKNKEYREFNKDKLKEYRRKRYELKKSINI